MVRRIALLGVALLALSGPAVAAAKTSVSQPYSAFPTPVANKKARNYYKHWHLKVTKQELARGVFKHPDVAALAPTQSLAASRRAGVDSGALGIGPLIVVGLVALGLATLAARRRPMSAR
jgi:hypothetical protein